MNIDEVPMIDGPFFSPPPDAACGVFVTVDGGKYDGHRLTPFQALYAVASGEMADMLIVMEFDPLNGGRPTFTLRSASPGEEGCQPWDDEDDDTDTNAPWRGRDDDA